MARLSAYKGCSATRITHGDRTPISGGLGKSVPSALTRSAFGRGRLTLIRGAVIATVWLSDRVGNRFPQPRDGASRSVRFRPWR
jgi:hypothetical protein